MCCCGRVTTYQAEAPDMEAAWAEAARLYADEIAEWAKISLPVALETWPEQ